MQGLLNGLVVWEAEAVGGGLIEGFFDFGGLACRNALSVVVEQDGAVVVCLIDRRRDSCVPLVASDRRSSGAGAVLGGGECAVVAQAVGTLDGGGSDGELGCAFLGGTSSDVPSW